MPDFVNVVAAVTHTLLTHTVLHEHRPQLPTNMLALMTELEKQGPVFATKMLITIVGACVCASVPPQPPHTQHTSTNPHSLPPRHCVHMLLMCAILP